MKPYEGIPLWIIVVHKIIDFVESIKQDVEFLILRLKGKQLLPPWVVYPEYPRSSMGWRMGGGEGYMHKWIRWFKQLSLSEKVQYCTRYPAPGNWQDFYEKWMNK